MADVKYKWPKALGACADRLYNLKHARLDLQRQADAIEAEEKALKEHLINTLPKSEAAGVTGKLARVTVVSKEVPQVKDWDAFYKHLGKTKDFSLLNRALNKSAVQERWEADKKVPGVEAFNAVTISINKV